MKASKILIKTDTSNKSQLNISELSNTYLVCKIIAGFSLYYNPSLITFVLVDKSGQVILADEQGRAFSTSLEATLFVRQKLMCECFKNPSMADVFDIAFNVMGVAGD